VGGVGKRGAAQQRFYIPVGWFSHSHFSDPLLFAGE